MAMKRPLVPLGIALLLTLGTVAAVRSVSLGAAASARTLFVGGTVLTMAGPYMEGGTGGTGSEGSAPRADAVLVVGDRIARVGEAGEVAAWLDGTETVVPLEGRTLSPGFVDAHGHFPAARLGGLGVDLAPPPAGDVADLPTLLARLGEAALADGPTDRWLLGFDHDDANLLEGRHPTRDELDAAVPDRPVWLRHRSGHMGVGNSRALEALGLDASYVAATGGAVRRDARGRLDGLVQERAAPPLSALLREVPPGTLLRVLREARDDYLGAGVTTVQNGHASPGMSALLAWAVRLGLLPQRVVLWPASTGDAVAAPPGLVARAGLDDERLHAGAVKLILDGSPQGLTAWMTAPYLAVATSIAGLDPAYRGFPTLDPEAFAAEVVALHAAGRDLAIHANGDAAIDVALDALETAAVAVPRRDARHFIVHAQTARMDQLERMARLGVSATFFPPHVPHWGDWHHDRALGPERAAGISPLASADAAGVRYSAHADAPVTPMRPLEIVDAAVERRTRSGRVLGARERVSRQRALRAVTIDAAWQNRLEHDRGSIEVGKLADLVVLSGDPLHAPRAADLLVDQVWIGGRRER